MKKPWEICVDLQLDKLTFLARLLADITANIVDRHDPTIGDTNTSLGMRIYECLKTNIIWLSSKHDWLNILTPGGRFTFTIGSTPMRFWSGESPEKLPSGKLIRSEEALLQLGLLDSPDQTQDLIWYCVLGRNDKRTIDRVHFVAYDHSEEICARHDINLNGVPSKIAPVSDSRPQAIELPSAATRLAPKKPKKQDDSANGD
ncbi:hypothetical protein EV700_2521 [Fluviicoccus keumensis]|uniref:Uncharacterized protein n=1 Tax=Fluviicoccus keumensis TaxID=1435465 RepID=A0A4V2G3V9_9GAMM|nr:hypothetical protein [Fluviicoccus keumensis]RZU38586.1 hypothetical protein EV700_2521 [Fluviicoccus keumensis]